MQAAHVQKERDEAWFSAAKAGIEDLKAATERGDIQLAYVDETTTESSTASVLKIYCPPSKLILFFSSFS